MQISKKITIINKLGLHARAAAKLVSVASRYACEIHIVKGTRTVNGKSIMGVMMLAASKGTEIELRLEGEETEKALAELESLINNRFNEAE